jgi:hypothetical protein
VNQSSKERAPKQCVKIVLTFDLTALMKTAASRVPLSSNKADEIHVTDALSTG